MERGFGIERPGSHAHGASRPRARYLVVIEAAGPVVALLFTEARELVAHIDAGSEEVAQMAGGRAPAVGAGAPDWDHALAGHSAQERAAAEVYTLEV